MREVRWCEICNRPQEVLLEGVKVWCLGDPAGTHRMVEMKPRDPDPKT